MRLNKVSNFLCSLDGKDREFVAKLAVARAGFTLSGYAKQRNITRPAALFRLNQSRPGDLFQRVKIGARKTSPFIFFLKRKFGAVYAPDYREPRTVNTVCDALLRARLIFGEPGNWSHHQRQPSVLVMPEQTHVADCLDRNETAVIQFASSLNSESPVVIHTGSEKRFSAFKLLRAKLAIHKEPQLEEEITWDNLFGERKRRIQKSSHHSNAQEERLRIEYHEAPVFLNLEV